MISDETRSATTKIAILTQKEEPSMHAYQLFRTLQVTLEQNTCFMSRDLTYERMTLVNDVKIMTMPVTSVRMT